MILGTPGLLVPWWAGYLWARGHNNFCSLEVLTFEEVFAEFVLGLLVEAVVLLLHFLLPGVGFVVLESVP